MYTSATVNSSIIIILEVLHLLEDLLMASNIHLEVVGLKLPLVLEGMQLLFELSGVALGKTWTKKLELKFLEGSVDVAGLVELINGGLSRGLFGNNPEFGIAHGRINNKLGGSVVIHLLELLTIDSIVVDEVLLDGVNREPFYHFLSGSAQIPITLFLCMRDTI